MADAALASCALVLHGRLGSWFAAASELSGAQAAGGKPAALSSPAALRAFAAFTHSSLWRHVVQPARTHGMAVRVVIHSWSPEVGSTLDALYHPAASVHEPPVAHLDKVTSQHRSMHRALNLLEGLGGPPDALVMVARLDLLLFSDVPLAALAASLAPAAMSPAATSTASLPPATTAALSETDALFLPHTCVPSRMRLPREQADAEARMLRRTCSGGDGSKGSAGRRMLPTQLSRYQAGAAHNVGPAEDFTMFVLDYFFIGTPRVAASFGGLATAEPEIHKRLRRYMKNPPQWAHLYWAEHVSSPCTQALTRTPHALTRICPRPHVTRHKQHGACTIYAHAHAHVACCPCCRTYARTHGCKGVRVHRHMHVHLPLADSAQPHAGGCALWLHASSRG